MSPIRQIRIASMCLLLSGLHGCVIPDSSIESPKRIEELEKENAELKQQLDILNKRLRVVTVCPFLHDPTFPPTVDALVLTVQLDSKTVTLDKGRKDRVEVGYTFDVYRGTEYKGRVRIIDVQEDWSSGVILSEKSPFAAGDSATTRL